MNSRITKKIQKINNFKYNFIYYNKAREAIYDVLLKLKENGDFTLLLPAYIGYSPNEGGGIFDPIKKLDIDYRFYDINDDITINIESFDNVISSIDKKIVVFIIHYFGYVDPNIDELINLSKRYNAFIIEDCAHAFYTDFVDGYCGNYGDVSIYSLHKMLPYNDGGLLKNNTNVFEFTNNISYNPFEYDLKKISEHRKKCSDIIESKLMNIIGIRILRPKELYGKYTPQTFPILLENMDRDEFYHKLNEMNYGVVSLYHTMIPEINNECSKNISKCILNLPVHQDAKLEDIKKMCDEVIRITNTYKIDKLQVISINDNRWDTIVKSFKDYTVFHLSFYVRAFQNNGDGEPLLIYYNDGTNRAINVVLKRDISLLDGLDYLGKDKYFDFITPYGYSSFVFEGDIKSFQKEYNDYCVNNNIVCEFVRFDLFSNSYKVYDGEVIEKMNNVVRNLDIPFNQILSSFKHKARKNIRQANEKGLKIEICYDDSKIDDFLRIYYHTMTRNNADKSRYYKKKFFEDLTIMNNNFVYFYAMLDEKVIASELVLYDDNNCYSYFGGTDSKYYFYKPNEFLKYEIIRWAYSRRLKNFVLGGGNGSDDGIYEYKLGFAPDGIYKYYIGQKVFNNDLYNKLCEITNNDLNNVFFPAYRLK